MATFRRALFGTLLLLGLLTPHARALEVSAIEPDGRPSAAIEQAHDRFQVSIADQVAALRASFQFRNRSGVPLELTCSFQLGPSELVDGFSYWNGTERIVGEVLERGAAALAYDELTGVRRDPGILEQTGDRFRFRVFPIAPGELKPVELTTVAALAMHDGFIEYVVPRANLPEHGGVFEFTADIADTLPIGEVQTPGIPAHVERQGKHRVRIRFETRAAERLPELRIRYRLEAPDYGMRLVTHRTPGEAEGSFMLIVSPKSELAAEDVIGRDIVFVTDVSGSMAGEPLAQSQRGLIAILAQLAPKDRFEVEAPELVHEVTRLGIVYDLVTPYTTFLAVPESEQTDEIKALMKQGKLGYDKRLIDTLQGIQLSQAAIPPGDPVLTVDAPADAREVTAFFPFGLVKRLAHDAERGHWYVRFLVPRDVADGRYVIKVRIVDGRGRVSWKEIDLAIDGTEPELRIDVDEIAWAGEYLHVAVDPLEPVREIFVTLPDVTKTRVNLELNVESGLYEGRILVPFLLPTDQLRVRVVARDRARNRVQEDVVLPVIFDGC